MASAHPGKLVAWPLSLADESQPADYRYWAEPHASTNPDLTRILLRPTLISARQVDQECVEMDVGGIPSEMMFW